MIQAKSMLYSLDQLVTDEERASRLLGGSYATIYLSPRDYHRVHSPTTARLLGYDYIPGSFFPVNPLFSRSVDRLMTRNERVVFHLQAESGAVSVVMVGALGVSNLEVAHDGTETRCLRRSGARRRIRFERPVAIQRGDELGMFHLGSTTIVIFEPGSVDLTGIRPGNEVRFGQPIGRVRKHADCVSPAGIVS